jgi:hypothetical protein
MDSNLSEEKIRALVAQAVATSDPVELEGLMGELREALRAHIQQTKLMIVSSWPSISSRK